MDETGRSRWTRLRGWAAAAFLAVPWGVAGLGGCSYGLRYDGDARGLHRETIEIPAAEGSRARRHLSYLEAGDPDGPRIIFIHGSPGRAVVYAGFVRDGFDGMETLAVDRLGYGGSGLGRPVLSMREQAAAIAPLLVERQGRWPIVVGHSLGAPIACRLAADNPGKVGALVLIGGALDPGLERVRWYNMAAGFPVVHVTLDEMLKVSNAEMFAARRELRALAPALGAIDCPVTIIHGTADRLVPFGNVRYMQQALTAAAVRVVALEGEGHFIPRRRADVVRAEIERLCALDD